MQTTRKAPVSKEKTKVKTSKDDSTTKKSQEEKPKKSIYSVTTPRNYVQKSSTADIYVQKKTSALQVTKAPKKAPGTTSKASNVTPMKEQLKSSPSSISTSSSKFKNVHASKTDVRTSSRAVTGRSKDLPFTNVTVNSPGVRKKLIKDGGQNESKDVRKSMETKEARKSLETKEARKNLEIKEVPSSISNSKEAGDRQRSKTRTLSENEVKLLSSEIDNNAEMKSLARKLTARPKAFYVDLDDQNKSPKQATELRNESIKVCIVYTKMEHSS
jgi:hypothetical protein